MMADRFFICYGDSWSAVPPEWHSTLLISVLATQKVWWLQTTFAGKCGCYEQYSLVGVVAMNTTHW